MISDIEEKGFEEVSLAEKRVLLAESCNGS